MKEEKIDMFYCMNNIWLVAYNHLDIWFVAWITIRLLHAFLVIFKLLHG